MPRLSDESRAAALFRAEAKRRAPPKRLNAEAKKIWLEITVDRPADWFRPGSWELLEQYCDLTTQQRKCCDALAIVGATEPEYEPLLRNATKLATALGTLASKLRISIQLDVERRSSKVDERGEADEQDPLLGGTVIAWPGERQSKPKRGRAGSSRSAKNTSLFLKED